MSANVRRWISTHLVLAAFLAAGLASAQAVRVADINTTQVAFDSLSVEPGVVLGGAALFGLRPNSEDEALLWRSDGSVAGTSLVKNVSPGRNNSLQGIVKLGALALFVAQDPAAGQELWRSDGTAAGTFRLVDLRPGPESSSPRNLTVLGTTLYFTANGGSDGTELWKSDGTAGGTLEVKDIRPGPLGSSAAALVGLGSTLFFTADDGTTGLELWKSNGTAAGTVRVKDIQPGAGGSEPYDLVAVGSTLFFAAEATVNDGELWKSDGSEAGTVLVKDIQPGAIGSFPSSLRALGSQVIFTADDGTTGIELWKSNGSAAGTVPILEIVPGPGGIAYYNDQEGLAVLGSALLISLDDGATGPELWRTDGTAAGTFPLADIEPGPDGSFPGGFAVLGATMLFEAFDTLHGGELWRTDGTPAGTTFVKDIFPGTNSANPFSFAVVGSVAILKAFSQTDDRELWRSDGTPGGTFPLTDPTPFAVTGSGPSNLTDSAGTLVFAADDGVHGFEPWKSNGSAAGTALMLDIAPGSQGSDPSEFTVAGGRTFFSARGPEGVELWKKTVASAILVEDIRPGTNPSSPVDLIEIGGTLYFSADDGVAGRELWKSDGFAADTSLVVDLTAGATGGGAHSIADSGAFGNGILFGGATAANGEEVYTSDGTGAGTHLVSNLNPGAASSSPEEFFVTGTVAFLSAETAAAGREPWVIVDAGIGGFVEVSLGNLNPGTAGSDPREFTAAGGTTYFVADDGAHGRELWKTNASAATTVLVKDTSPGLPSGEVTELTSFAGRLFFRACDATSGCELWTSDGTTGGTQLFKDLFPGPDSGDPSHLTVSGDDLWFSACDGAAGCELWVSDGTPQRTRRASDIHAGPESSNPRASRSRVGDTPFVASGGRLYFVANDGSGEELWAATPLLFDDGFEAANTAAWSATVP